jgi:energy-converting hydrogenase Eha subunit G
VNDIFQWLNLLLIPGMGLLVQINSRLAGIEATQKAHAGRLTRLDGITN